MNRPNRKARRQLAKSLGLNKIKQNARSNNLTEWTEMIRRANHAGKQIHISNLEDNYNRKNEEDLYKEIETLNDSQESEDTKVDVIDAGALNWAQQNLQNSDWDLEFKVDKNNSDNE